MKKFILILFVVLGFSSFGQNISSIKQELDTALLKNDSSFYFLSKNIAEHYEYLYPDSSLLYLDNAITVAESWHDLDNQIEITLFKADVLNIKHQYDDAVDVYFYVLELLSDRINTEEYAKVLISLSNSIINSNLKNELAKIYLFQALDIAEHVENDVIKVETYQLLSNLYSLENNIDSAIFIINKAIVLSNNIKNNDLKAYNYYYYSLIYFNDLNYIPAITYLKRSITIVENEDLKNEFNMFLASIYYKMGHYSSASNVLNKALIYCIKTNNNVSLIKLFLHLADYENLQNNIDFAIKNAQDALKLSKNLNIIYFQIKSYHTLSVIYSENQQIDLALISFKKYSSLKDSVFTESMDKESELMFSNYVMQIKLKERQLLLQQKQNQILKNKQQSLVIYILASLGILLIITFFILLRSFFIKTKSELRLKQIIEATLDGIYIHDGFKILDVNDKFCEISAYTRDELINKSIMTILTEQSKLQVNEKMSLKKTSFYQMQLLKKDGTVYNAEVLSKPFVFKGISAKIVAIRDLTKITKIEEKLQKTKEQFQSLVEISPDGVVITDTEGIITYVSPAFKSIFKSDNPDTFIGAKLANFVTQTYKNKMNIDLTNIMFGNYDGITEYCAKKSNGDEFYIECNGNAFKNIHGEVSGVFMIIRDVTERKIVENALIESESRFRGLFNNAKDAIIILNKKYKIVDANPFTSEMLKFSYDELLTLDFRELLKPEMRNFEFNDIVDNKNILESYIYIKNRKRVYIQVSFSKLKYSNGDFYLLTIKDLTLFKRQEENLQRIARKLQESNATKDKMFSIIGHDLRGPIGNLQTMIEFIAENPEEFDEAELIDVISSMRDTSTQTYALLENLLSWAKTQQNLLEYRPVEFDILDIVTNSVNFSQNIANAKNIEIEVICKRSFNIIADENMIKAVLRNLISNSIKFSEPDSKITVEIVDDNDRALLKVIDRGVGISDENLQQIFKEGSFITTYGTKNEKGTGLGLKLCKDFILKNNGKIWVESKPTKGSTFLFTLKKA